MQQLKYTKEEWCIEWTCRTEHKRQKNRKRKACVQKDSEQNSDETGNPLMNIISL